jgi:hypothetical protein
VDFQIAADLGNQKAQQLMKKYFSRWSFGIRFFIILTEK